MALNTHLAAGAMPCGVEYGSFAQKSTTPPPTPIPPIGTGAEPEPPPVPASRAGIPVGLWSGAAYSDFSRATRRRSH